MGEAVQDPGAFAEAVDRSSVVLLIEEEACLLAVFHVDYVADAVLGDLHFGIEGRRQKALFAGEALELADLGVASLIDSAHADAVLVQHGDQGCQNIALQAVNAKREGFHDQNIFVLVDSQSRQEIGLSEDQAAAGGVDHLLSVLPGASDPLREKGGRHRLFPAAGEKAHSDLGLCIHKAVSHEISVEVLYGQNIAVPELTAQLGDLVVVDPQAP